jgi:hypothetical protein
LEIPPFFVGTYIDDEKSKKFPGFEKIFMRGELFWKKKMVASDLRVCFGGLTPPFRTGRKQQTSFPPPPLQKNF